MLTKFRVSFSFSFWIFFPLQAIGDSALFSPQYFLHFFPLNEEKEKKTTYPFPHSVLQLLSWAIWGEVRKEKGKGFSPFYFFLSFFEEKVICEKKEGDTGRSTNPLFFFLFDAILRERVGYFFSPEKSKKEVPLPPLSDFFPPLLSRSGRLIIGIAVGAGFSFPFLVPFRSPSSSGQEKGLR